MIKRDSTGTIFCWPVDAWGAAAVLALTLLAYFVGLAPMQQRRAEVQQRRRDLAQKSAQSSELAGRARLLGVRVANVRRELEQNGLRLQPLNGLNQRLAEVTAAAAECGLDVGDIRPGPSISGARHTLVPIDLAGSGNYRNCVEFLHRFHGRFADSGVASFALTRNPADPKAPTTFHFNLIWYVQPLSASATLR